MRAGWVVIASLLASAARASDLTPDEARRLMKPLMSHCTDEVQYRKLKRCLDVQNKEPYACNNELTRDAPSSDKIVNPDAYSPGGDLARPLTEAAADLVRKVVADSPLPALNGTLESFVPILQPNLLQPFGNLEEPQTLGLSINFDRLLWFKARAGGYFDPVPKMNAALKDALIARNQLGSFSDRESSLDVGDDYYLVADVALESSWLGRQTYDNATAQSRLTRTVIAGRDIGDESLPTQRLLDVGTALMRDLGNDDSRKAVACAAEIYLDLAGESDARQAQVPLQEFWRLVHNQPQLVVSYRQLHRDELVGSNATTYRAKFTTGILNNIDWLRLLPGCDRNLGGDQCPQKFADMVSGFAMKYGLGLAAYFEWGNIADVDVMVPSLTGQPNPLPQIDLPIQLPIVSTAFGDDIQIKGGGYRRYGWSVGGTFKHPDPGEAFPTSIRLDGGVDYYRYEGNSVRLSHNVARITLTYRRGPFSFPLHLMYRTKGELDAHPAKDLVVGVGTEMNFAQW